MEFVATLGHPGNETQGAVVLMKNDEGLVCDIHSGDVATEADLRAYLSQAKEYVKNIEAFISLPELQILSSISSDALSYGDADDMPQHEGEGFCCYWGAEPDSPVPDHRVFVVFNREPKDQEEADRVANEYFGES